MNTATDKRPGFFMIGNAVVDIADLTPYEIAVYVFIVRHVNGKSGVAFPSTQTIADRTHMSKPKAIECVVALESKGLLSVVRRFAEDGKSREVNHYYVENYTGVVNENNHTGKPEQSGVVNEVAHNNTESNKTKEKIFAPATQDADVTVTSDTTPTSKTAKKTKTPKVKTPTHPLRKHNPDKTPNPYKAAVAFFWLGKPYVEWTKSEQQAERFRFDRLFCIGGALELLYDELDGFTPEQLVRALQIWVDRHPATPPDQRPRETKLVSNIGGILKQIVNTDKHRIVKVGANLATLIADATPPHTDWREHAKLAQELHQEKKANGQ